MSGVGTLLSSGGRRLPTQKEVVTSDVGVWPVTPAAEGAGRHSRCADAAFVFSPLAWLSCVQLSWVHPAFLADDVTRKQNKTCLMPLMLQLLPNVSITLEQTPVVETSVVAKPAVPAAIFCVFGLFPLSPPQECSLPVPRRCYTLGSSARQGSAQDCMPSEQECPVSVV